MIKFCGKKVRLLSHIVPAPQGAIKFVYERYMTSYRCISIDNIYYEHVQMCCEYRFTIFLT